MMPRLLLILGLLLPILFVYGAILSFLPWPWSCVPLIFFVALPLAQRVSSTLGVGLIVLFGLSVSLFNIPSALGWHYFIAAVVVGLGTYRFFASRSGVAYIGLCMVTALSFSLGTGHLIVYGLLVFSTSMIGGSVFVWLSSLRHMFLPLRTRSGNL